MAIEIAQDSRALHYNDAVKGAFSTVDIQALRLALIEAKNAGVAVDTALEALAQREREVLSAEETQKRRENNELPLTRDEVLGLQFLEAVVAGDKRAIDALLADENYNPNVLFSGNVPIRTPAGDVLPILTDGKALLHLLPAVVTHSPMSTDEVKDVVTRLVTEKEAAVNQVSAEGKTALDYAVESASDKAVLFRENALAMVDALLSQNAVVSKNTVTLIVKHNSTDIANHILSHYSATVDQEVLPAFLRWGENHSISVFGERSPFSYIQEVHEAKIAMLPPQLVRHL